MLSQPVAERKIPTERMIGMAFDLAFHNRARQGEKIPMNQSGKDVLSEEIARILDWNEAYIDIHFGPMRQSDVGVSVSKPGGSRTFVNLDPSQVVRRGHVD